MTNFEEDIREEIARGPDAGVLRLSANHWIEYQKFPGVHCKRYCGKLDAYDSPGLRGKARTGLWYTTHLGQPFTEVGEGETPLAAIQDAINRSREKAGMLTRAVLALEQLLPKQ